MYLYLAWFKKCSAIVPPKLLLSLLLYMATSHAVADGVLFPTVQTTVV